jgi:hypothetical protein
MSVVKFTAAPPASSTPGTWTRRGSRRSRSTPVRRQAGAAGQGREHDAVACDEAVRRRRVDDVVRGRGRVRDRDRGAGVGVGRHEPAVRVEVAGVGRRRSTRPTSRPRGCPGSRRSRGRGRRASRSRRTSRRAERCAGRDDRGAVRHHVRGLVERVRLVGAEAGHGDDREAGLAADHGVLERGGAARLVRLARTGRCRASPSRCRSRPRGRGRPAARAPCSAARGREG